MSGFQLRGYQVDARDAVLREWEAGRRTLLSMPTGTGKTDVFLSVLDEERRQGRLSRALVLVHRTELAQQVSQRVSEHWPELGPVGIVQAESDDTHAMIVAATVQTVSQDKRLARMEDVSHLVIDEAHHGVAPTYLAVADGLRKKNPDTRILGVTATPSGGSGYRGLGDLIDSTAYRMTLRQAIRAHHLVPFVAQAVELPVSFADVPIHSGDYVDHAAGEVMRRPDALALIVKTWGEHASDRKTLAFASSVQQAADLCETFRNYGVDTEFIHGGTPAEERRGIIENFKHGGTRVLVNCAVLTEGVDLPMAACLVQAKPTRSDAAYIQMIGRVLRLYPGKRDALVLDYVPKDARKLYSSADLRETLVDRNTTTWRSPSFGIMANGQEVDGDLEELHLRILDYFDDEPLAWTFDGELASASVGAFKQAAVQQSNGHYSLWLIERNVRRIVGHFDSWEEAVERTEALIDDDDAERLTDKGKKWRRLPASEKQIDLLRRLGLFKQGIKRGEAGKVISHHFARRAVMGK